MRGSEHEKDPHCRLRHHVAGYVGCLCRRQGDGMGRRWRGLAVPCRERRSARGAMFLLHIPKIPLMFGVGIDSPFSVGLTADYWFAHGNLVSILDYYVGVGAYAQIFTSPSNVDPRRQGPVRSAGMARRADARSLPRTGSRFRCLRGAHGIRVASPGGCRPQVLVLRASGGLLRGPRAISTRPQGQRSESRHPRVPGQRVHSQRGCGSWRHPDRVPAHPASSPTRPLRPFA